MEAPYMVRGRAGPEFQIRLPQDLRTATGVAALRVRLPHQGRRGLRDEALKRAGVAKALFEGLRRMDRDKLKTLSRAELQAMLSDAIQGLNAAWDVPPETDKTESVARAADKLAAIGSELFGRPSPMPDLASREDMRWFALSVALSRARDEGRPLITADTDDLLARLLQSHLARPGRTAMPAPSEQPMLGALQSTSVSSAAGLSREPMPSTTGPDISAHPKPKMPASSSPDVAAVRRKHPISNAFDAYRSDLRARTGSDNDHLRTIDVRKQMFIALNGDIDVSEVTNPVLREFGYAMSFLPAKTARDSAWTPETLIGILRRNGYRTREEREGGAEARIALPCISETTLVDKIVNIVRTAVNFHCGEHNDLTNPLASFRFVTPAHTPRPKRRKKPTDDAVTRLLEAGREDGRLVQAMFPLLGACIGRRLGLLAYLRAENLEARSGHFLMSVKQRNWMPDGLHSAPLKTQVSETPFVLHPIFEKIGFVDFVRRKGEGWVFESLHVKGIVEPSHVAQKRMDALIAKACIEGTVFHQLRHFVIGEGRNSRLPPDIRRKQVGHGPEDSHDHYAAEWEDGEIDVVASLKLPDAIAWEQFLNFDFDKAEKLCRAGAIKEQRRRGNL